MATIDQRIIDWLVGEVKNKYGVDLSKDKIALQRLKEAAEQAKKELSSSMSTTINMQYLAMTPDGIRCTSTRRSPAPTSRK